MVLNAKLDQHNKTVKIAVQKTLFCLHKEWFEEEESTILIATYNLDKQMELALQLTPKWYLIASAFFSTHVSVFSQPYENSPAKKKKKRI